ncbi:MAG: alkaline phosphatase family protein [Candidatus Kerfeldbacteria bacterium]|nr:alkaline phosphatase family protein [Candidatus Kerfeldbacteria bacterium]
MDKRKVMVIGLDCATPQLLFERYKKDLPNISRLMEQGTWGKLRSTTPPITVPAWAAMTTSKHAGDLGVYGFRSRKAGAAYDDMDIAHGGMITEKRVWDYLGDAGYKVGMLGVPQTYPITKPVNGMQVTCFLTPSTKDEFTWPRELKKEIVDMVAPDDYIFDFANRSQEPPEKALEIIIKMTKQRQKIFRHWVQNKNWDFLMMVEMGVDRIHHYLWHFMDPQHKDYLPGNPFEGKILDYYRDIDAFIGEMQQLAPKDTVLYVVSDHGAKRMEGMFVINEWLIDHGYLVLKSFPSTPTTIEKCDVDWSRTKAWAWGGFYSRLFVNVAGREPQGCVPPEEVDALLEEIRTKLMEERVGPNGEEMPPHQIYRSQELYDVTNGDSPDLLIFWGDLFWKVAGTVGYHTHYIEHDDKGLDYGVHDWNGVFVKYDPAHPGKGERPDLNILDVTPTILHDFGITIPSGLRGKVI